MDTRAGEVDTVGRAPAPRVRGYAGEVSLTALCINLDAQWPCVRPLRFCLALLPLDHHCLLCYLDVNFFGKKHNIICLKTCIEY